MMAIAGACVFLGATLVNHDSRIGTLEERYSVQSDSYKESSQLLRTMNDTLVELKTKVDLLLSGKIKDGAK